MSLILLTLVLLPLVGAAAIGLLGRAAPDLPRRIALAATVASLVLAAVVMIGFVAKPAVDAGPPSTPPPQMTTNWVWLEKPDVRFHLGIDGLSLWLVILTALLSLTAVLSSWTSIRDRQAEHYALLLVLETGMLGVFTALDIVLFYVFFEFTLIPLYFLIGLWGGPERRDAARKFFLYTLAGSVLTLLGLLYVVVAYQAQNGVLTF